jgi:hypothetical protein
MAGPGRAFPLVPGVQLSDAQREKIAAALAAKGITLPAPPDENERRAHRADMVRARDALLDGFVADDFEASKSLPKPFAIKLRLVEVLAVALPLLDADQREAAAVTIEQGPPGPRGHRGPPPAAEDQRPR